MTAAQALRNKFKYDKDSPWSFYGSVILWSFVVACCITIPFILVEWVKTGSPVFLYYGDYNAQQICFYEHAIAMVQSGDFGWDWVTDMGSNFVGSYSYYMLGSPFFWMMCIFPSSWAPYLMGPMYIVKYVFAAVMGYAYLQRFVKNKNYAVIGALLYAFSGFQIYNTFFNQFHDVVAFFPLLLIGMEEYIQNDRKGLFAIAVTINALINYFMFAGQVVFCVIYFIARFTCGSFRKNVTVLKFIGLCFEAVIGFAMSWFMFIPAASALMGNSRISNSYIDIFKKMIEYFGDGDSENGLKQLKKLLVWTNDGKLYWQRYGQIFESYFFPPDIPSRVNFFDGHETRWASISMYLPMFALSGFFALFTVKKRTWLKSLIIFLIIASFIPVLNSMFFLFNSSYYARWLYMMIMMLCLATVVALEDSRTKWRVPTAIMTFFCTAVAVPLGLIWYNKEDEGFELGYPPYYLRFWIYVGIAFLGIILTAYIIRKYRGTKFFEKALLIGVSGMTIIYGCVHITNGKQYSEKSKFMVDQIIEGTVTFDDDPQEHFFRIDQYKSSSVSTIDNLGIYWNYPTIECFHTVVPPSIMEFYPYIGVTRNVGSRAESSLYGLRAFTSVKYSLIQTNENYNKKTDEVHDTYGFEYYKSENGYDIYKNENYIPMGFAYSQFMTETDFEKEYKKSERHAVLCKYLVVPDDMAEYYSQFMTQATQGVDATQNNFEIAVDERRSMCCYEFNYSSYGFDAKIDLDEPNIVYFSVPYEENGWTATVNGKEAEVLRVTYGFVAVECEAGENEIVFNYSTPGFIVGCDLTVGENEFTVPGGLWLSLIGLAVFVIYMSIVALVRHFTKRKPKASIFGMEFYDDCGAVFDEPETEMIEGEKQEADAAEEVISEINTLEDDSEAEVNTETEDNTEENE